MWLATSLSIFVLAGNSLPALAEDGSGSSGGETTTSPSPTVTPHIETHVSPKPTETPHSTVSPKPSTSPRTGESESPRPTTDKSSPSPSGTPNPLEQQEKRKELCKLHQEDVLTRSHSMIDRGLNMQKKFDQISTEVEKFYETKLQPSGITVSNYAALKADVAAKRNAVATAESASVATTTSLNCTTDPKNFVTNFSQNVRALDTAMKAYRDSIKALIDAVKTAVKAAATPVPSPLSKPAATTVSPRPSESPETSHTNN